jgi:ATP-binding cassette subfamily F protein 3
VTLSLAGRPVLRGVDLQHNPGEKLVLVGRNGSGKTSLLRIIAGELEADGGTVERAGGLEISRLEQILTAPASMTALDFCLSAVPRVQAIEGELAELEGRAAEGDERATARIHELHEEYERLDGWRLRPRAEAALDGVGIPRSLYRRPLGELSGGERTRVALARALLAPADLLLLDEPTNHLDLLGAAFLASELAQRDRALLVVTHDRELIDRVGGEILELHSGRLERYGSSYARYRREREARRAQARRAYELQQREIQRQEEFIRRNIAGQNTRQAQARQALLERMTRLEAPEPDLPAVKLRWDGGGRFGERVLEVEEVAVGWGGVRVLEGVTFLLRRGERLAVVGRNGSGKSTLLRTIVGSLPALAGAVKFGTGVIPGFYDQEQADLPAGETVLATLLAARPDWTPAEGRGWAGRFGFSGEAAELPCRLLSGGERSRLALARLIAAAPNLLLLDEPTNHLDLITCEALEEALAEYPGAVVLVSHDRRLLERIATGVLVLEGGRARTVARVEEAFEQIGGTPRSRAEGREVRTGARRSPVEEERRKLRRDVRRAQERAAALAGELEQMEARLREIEAALCDRTVYTDARKADLLVREAEALRTQRDATMEAWVEAEDDAAALEARLAELG